MPTDSEAQDREPRQAYGRRLEVWRRVVAEESRRADNLAYLRLVVFLSGLLIVWPALFSKSIHWAWLLAPLLLFLGLVWFHGRAHRHMRRARRAVAFFDRGLRRLDGQWAGQGTSGQRYADPAHPYAGDLDLFGEGSLFELVCAARTTSGERTLARWLREPGLPDELRERQQAVRELQPRLDLREEIAILGEDVQAGVDPDDLIEWADSPPVLTTVGPRVAAAVLALSNLATLAFWARTQLLLPAADLISGSAPFVASLLLSMLLGRAMHRRLHRVLGAVNRPERELELLSEILERTEQARFRSPYLVRLRAALDSEGQPPSLRIRRLARLVELHDSQHNMIFAPLAGLLLLGIQLAYAIEGWRIANGDAVHRWLAAVGEIEAISSLAGYRFEHPDDPFPEIVAQGPLFVGESLAHPLLPETDAVRNDVRLDRELRMLLVSGSNMSGKSTLLRTVGVNAVLALAGGPVRARGLRLSPLAIGACMRVQDSLQQGLSHFYAEIKRLRQIVGLESGRVPVLFLLDEILHGTNSHDRRLGAEALVRGLLERGSIGLVTTHDLALAEIVDTLGRRAANVHFEDRLEGERILFDYRLRPGVVRRGNALGLMRAVGLDV